MKKQTERIVLVFFAFFLLFWNVSLMAFLLTHALGTPATGRVQDTGVVQLCINHPPTLTVPCNATMSQGVQYLCQLNVTDVDSGSNFSYAVVFDNAVVFSINATGIINFTPGNNVVGNHIADIFAFDNSNCVNNGSNDIIFNFTVANVNDPPYLIKAIPDVELPVNTTLGSFFLLDYFSDPDLPYGDALNFTSSLPAGITVQILPSSQVVFTSNVCDETGKVVTFTAHDLSNATADSNPVTVRVICPKTSTGGENNNQGAGGGGGGGGSAYICKELWECDDWFPCLPANIQWRRCFDKRGCRSEQYLKQECVYQGPPPACKENWLCEDWGRCYLNSTQYRSCKDLNACGTDIVRPPVSQSCNYEPTCNDGLQNGNETGIDCGGDKCPVCPLVQQPRPLPESGGIPTWLLIALLLSILVVSGVVRYYRAQIAQLVATLGFVLKHRGYKEILLDAAQRKSLFERVRAFEVMLKTPAGKELAPAIVYTTLGNLIRGYYVEALGLHTEAIPEELDARCREFGLREETVAMLKGLFAKLAIVEQEDLEMDDYFVMALIEEMRTVVCMTSDYKHEELLRPVEEIAVSENMSFYDEIFARLVNALRAGQFDQLEDARHEYMTILTRYEPLSEQEKEQIYPELQWLFQTIKFQSEITGAKVVNKPAPVA